MKQSLNWHRMALANARAVEDQCRKERVEITHKLNRLEAENERYAAQIMEARRRGMDGFDSERFMKKKGAK
jgi:hypothetical protein